MQLAAEQGYVEAPTVLDLMQQANAIPTPRLALPSPQFRSPLQKWPFEIFKTEIYVFDYH